MGQTLSHWRDTRDLRNPYRMGQHRMGQVNEEACAFFKLFIHFFVMNKVRKLTNHNLFGNYHGFYLRENLA